ncbi:MAG: peptidoglycan-binding domain-containing protein [Magnetovibrionaceae bacterium]
MKPHTLTKRLFAGLGLALLVHAAAPVAVAEAAPVRDVAFQAMASELLDGLKDADVRSLPAQSGYGKPSLAVQPFTEAASPVGAQAANGFNRRLLAHLQAKGRDNFQFIDRQAVEAVIRDIRSDSSDPHLVDQRITELRAASRADILVLGHLERRGDRLVLSYQAVNAEDARILAVSRPRDVRMADHDALLAERSGWPNPDEPAPGIQIPPSPRAQPVTPVEVAPLDLSDIDLETVSLPRPADYRPRVDEAEQLLARKGYDPGPVDGVMTRQTRKALRAYQSDSALPINGRLTRQVVENLRRDRR